MVQATPATSGGTNSGTSPAVAINVLQGVLVRTTIQAKPSPITTAIAVPPPHTRSVLTSAKCTLGLARTSMKWSSEMAEGLNPSTTGLVPDSAP